jgi:polar amino acid transport system substrate-binding protein
VIVDERRYAAVICDLAPTGVLRVAINYGNRVLAQRSGGNTLRGVAVDLALEAGRQLMRPVELVPHAAAGQVVAEIDQGSWDIACLAIDPERRRQIDFTPPYLLIEAAYLVREESPLRDGAGVDADGTRIAVGAGSAYELHLSRTLRHATLERRDTAIEAFELLQAGEVDVAAGVLQVIERFAKQESGLRVLRPSFLAIEQALGVPRQRHAGNAWLGDFIERMKASGFVAESLAANGQTDAVVTSPASSLNSH